MPWAYEVAVDSSWGYEWRHQGDFWSKTELMALKSGIFDPSIRVKITPLRAYISLVWKWNLKIASMAPFLWSWATSRYPLCPWHVIDVGCKGGAIDFAASSHLFRSVLYIFFSLSIPLYQVKLVLFKCPKMDFNHPQRYMIENSYHAL